MARPRVFLELSSGGRCSYDAASDKWHQTWIDSNGAPLYLDGGLVDGHMVLTDGIVSPRIKLYRLLMDTTRAFPGYFRRNSGCATML